jgi:hypothetical protein
MGRATPTARAGHLEASRTWVAHKLSVLVTGQEPCGWRSAHNPASVRPKNQLRWAVGIQRD